ncbi:Flagellum site-determining protein YlxH [Roseovarius sp. THAF27]|uniref:Mrp/NBP35 family ATP-binding protein n=1 Tax=Roseovarius sp. THAF27 TaxID=2587850 RepID=UPI001268FA68|nr:Mrp/NBP35 family ATP-binding protein [Roseovarius sp. THAF27]QFT80299.1 Flagellum site-determining protein YlxH [Roseovarius sp. THAF27]
MTKILENVRRELDRLELPDGGTVISRDMVRAMRLEGGEVRFVLEAPSPEMARRMEPLRAAAERAALSVEGVTSAQVALTAEAPEAPAPTLKVGRHPEGGSASIRPSGVKSILAVASGKGGVGKSTVASNLAVALARAGRRVGLLDADIHGPSQPRMMGVTERAQSPDGKILTPLEAHGVKMMSIGLMIEEDRAVVWRGPMLMGALQQMMAQVDWGELDALLVDLPPGTGDVQLTLCQRAQPTGALVVSTPQDVALLDARKAIDMFNTLKTPVLGLIENMSMFHCPQCGYEAAIFGHGGVAAEAERLGLPLLGALPIDLDTRLGGDAGRPVALEDGAVSDAYARLAERLVQGGMA